LATIQLFTRLVNKFRLSVSQAAYVYNTFLLPKLELRLRYIHGPQAAAWIKSYDRTLVASIEHMVSSPVRLSHSAVAQVADFLLPSWLEVAIKVSELFLRMNSVDCRWGRMGRQLMRQQVGSAVDKHFDRRKNTDSGTRLQRAAAHAVNRLSWSMQLRDESSRRVTHLFDREPAGILPGLDVSSGANDLLLDTPPGTRVHVVHDCWTGWGAAVPPCIVHVYTDGFFEATGPLRPDSSWAIAVRDEWLNCNFAHLPTDEFQLTRAHVGDAVLFGACISNTSGIYAAELQAIAHALAFSPLHTLSSMRTVAVHWRESKPMSANATRDSAFAWQRVLCSSSLHTYGPFVKRPAALCIGITSMHTQRTATLTASATGWRIGKLPERAPAQVSRSLCSYASCSSRTANITWRFIKNFRLVVAACSSMTSAVLQSPFSKPPHWSNGLRVRIHQVESCATAHSTQRC
jgi:hypothetical protein